VHPIERLRSIARASGVDQQVLVREAAGALAQLAGEPGQLLTACRRIVALQPGAASLWWLTSRVLASADPAGEVWRAADALTADGTDRELAHALAEDATMMSPSLGEVLRRAALRRGDLTVLHVDVLEDRSGHRSLFEAGLGDGEDAGSIVTLPGAALGSAAAIADLVVIEIVAAGAAQVLAQVGSLAATAVARQAEVPVWGVAPLGTVLPEEVWRVARDRIAGEEPWERGTEVLDAALLTQIVRPTGARPVRAALEAPDCGVVPELLVAGDVT
jgi:hypothetical protein